jgi:hypothetical protein
MSLRESVLGRVVASLLVAGMTVAPVAALAQRAGRGTNNPIRDVPVTGTAADGQSFTGTFDIQRFEAVGDKLLAVGELNGKFSGGKPVNHQSVAFPVQSISSGGNTTGFGGATGALHRDMKAVPATWDPAHAPTIVPAQASCDVLNLVLGPLHLDLLGLVVDLNQVLLDITAQTGAGNLLGNLLCAVTGLLDGAGALVDIAQALSAIANLLNGLTGGL